MFFKLYSITHAWRQLVKGIMVSCVMGLLLSGCNRSEVINDDISGITILADEVIVDKSFVYSSAPERYQPSYNLRGALAPIEQTDIVSPYTGKQLDIVVKTGDWVKKGQILAHLQTELESKVALSAKYEFIDVLTDEHTSLSESSANNSIEDTIEESIPDGVGLYESNDEESTYGEVNKSEVDSKVIDSDVTNSDVSNSDISMSNLSEKDKVDNNIGGSDTIRKDTRLKEQLDKQTTISKDKALVAKGEKEVTSSNDSNNDNSKNNDENSANKPNEDKPQISKSKNPQKVITSLTFRSPIEGEVVNIDTDITSGNRLAPQTPFMTIADTRQLQLIGRLPLKTGDVSTESQLSVGQSVNFKVYDVHTEFTGQISHVTPDIDNGYLVVRAPVIPSAENKVVLEYGMQALMTIDYGQIELGVRLPREAIHDADLDSLNKKYTRPVSPISGYVWVIQQDERLAYTPIEVVKYFPESDQFLVHGISNDTLICTAHLPKSSDGKRLSIK